jgi:hypothetical protein
MKIQDGEEDSSGVYYNHEYGSGTDRNLDNDGSWDYQTGGVDQDLDNDSLWDY